MSGSYDCTVKLWNVLTGTLQSTLKGHSSRVWIVLFSPNGKLIASGSHDSTVKLWDATTGALQSTFEGHSDSANAAMFYPNSKLVAFSPDCKLMASALRDNAVGLWDVESGALRSTLEGHSRSVNAVVFSPDGKLVASASEDSTVKLWDAVHASLVKEFINTNIDEIPFNQYAQEVSYQDGSARKSDTGSVLLSKAGIFSLDGTRSWITFDDNKLLSLPPEAYPSVYAIRNNTVVLGSGSGRITFLWFREDHGYVVDDLFTRFRVTDLE